MKKRILCAAIAAFMLIPMAAAFSGCSSSSDSTVILKVYNWEEYIDEGGEGSLLYDELAEGESEFLGDDFLEWYENTMGCELEVTGEGPSVIDDFEVWYEHTYGTKVKVEYSTFGTNEDMYNEIKLGNKYDLICPSDYMIMKLAAEGRLEKYEKEFFDDKIEENYYIKNVSPYIQEKFETNAGLPKKESQEETYYWSEYAAGYMWGTTGFVYNPEEVDEDELESLGWQAFVNEGEKYKNKITAKDNVRDTYFAALGVTFEKELLSLADQYANGEITAKQYTEKITAIFNDTSEETIAKVEPVLMSIKKNIYSFETDTGKADLVNGNINLNYAWSGDAVYAMDLAEEENDKYYNYFVPLSGSNLWFDGWVMPSGVTERGTKHAAQAFVNFLSMPYNAMRNSYYIGYTSAISGENAEMVDYIDYLHGEEESDSTIEYDLSTFFGEEAGAITIIADAEQATSRQLYAQYPSTEVLARCAVMNYYDEQESVRINELWSRVKAETLDAWAIVVICLAVVAIVLVVLFVKFKGKIDLFRHRPKKGYHKVEDPE